eukprot:gb/GECG01008308.1/.p1 GENE.gb/GECG01008308.1/~~gb/GECG01008308.1/.p1  ORF type:complete len:201 (+),score=19.92 gb/GECG01008308.1/:1-603(+)
MSVYEKQSRPNRYRNVAELTRISAERRQIRVRTLIRCLATGAIGYFGGKLLAHTLFTLTSASEEVPRAQKGALGKDPWKASEAFQRYYNRLGGIYRVSKHGFMTSASVPKYIGRSPLLAAGMGFVGMLLGAVTVPQQDKHFLQQNPPATRQEWLDAYVRTQPTAKLRVAGVNDEDVMKGHGEGDASRITLYADDDEDDDE